MEWLTTGQAAAMLGASITTIRNMAARGELAYRVTSGRERQKWAISHDSAQAWLAANGRIDERRHNRHAALAQDADVRQQLASVMQQVQYLQADRDRLSEEIAVLRAVALQLRARNAAVSEAESHQAEASRLQLEATRAQARATEALRRGLSAGDDALGQFLVPGPPSND